MSSKSLGDCASVLLDTGVVIEAIQPKTSTDRQKLVHDILKHLSKTKTKNGLVRRFYISDISLSEIANISTVNNVITKLHPILRVSNLSVVPFDTEIAVWLSNNFADLLNQKVLNRIARESGYPSEKLQMAREWINRDMMIVATGKHYNVDLALTTEKYISAGKTTFWGLSAKAGLFCAPTYKEFFMESHGDDFFPEFNLGNLKPPSLT